MQSLFSLKVLDDEGTRKKCYEIVEEAEGRTKMNMEEKRKLLRKQGKPQVIDEDDPEKYKQAVKVLTMKLFADLERKRRTLEAKISEDAAKKRAAELEAEEKRDMVRPEVDVYCNGFAKTCHSFCRRKSSLKTGRSRDRAGSTPGLASTRARLA